MTPEAIRDLVKWKSHVADKRKNEGEDRSFDSYADAVTRATDLLQDFDDEPEDSVITVFKYQDGYQIDAITNHPEFELYKDCYEPEDVVAIVYFDDGRATIKRMQNQI